MKDGDVRSHKNRMAGGANSRLFQMLTPYSKIKTAKIRTAQAAAV